MYRLAPHGQRTDQLVTLASQTRTLVILTAMSVARADEDGDAARADRLLTRLVRTASSATDELTQLTLPVEAPDSARSDQLVPAGEALQALRGTVEGVADAVAALPGREAAAEALRRAVERLEARVPGDVPEAAAA
jgi:hypothetical protein